MAILDCEQTGAQRIARAVVNERLREHGISNLRVADASIMPVIPDTHTNNASVMIGDRLSDFVKEDS